MHMRSKIILISLFLAMIIICVSACRNAGRWLIKKDDPVRADGIILLMGSFPDRVLEVSDLYAQGLSDHVIFVKESMKAYKILEKKGVKIYSTSEQVSDILVALGIPAENIHALPGDATSTLMEAMVIREYLKNQTEYDTLLLVSSASHTRRASMIFESVMLKAGIMVHIVSIPSNYTGFNADYWWRNSEDIQMVIIEYLKIADFFLTGKKKIKKGLMD